MRIKDITLPVIPKGDIMKQPGKPSARKTVKTIIFILLFILASSFIAGGIITGGYSSVRNKAIRICNECIGIG